MNQAGAREPKIHLGCQRQRVGKLGANRFSSVREVAPSEATSLGVFTRSVSDVHDVRFFTFANVLCRTCWISGICSTKSLITYIIFLCSAVTVGLTPKPTFRTRSTQGRALF